MVTLPTLPQTLHDLSADVMTSLLGRGFPGTVVTDMRIGRIISGTCTKVRLLLDYNDAGHRHGLPPTMCLKGAFESHGLAGQVYPREVWFYGHLAGAIGGGLPKCYFAGLSDRQAIVVMEDLLARNARFARASDEATVDQIRSLVELLAAVHGRFWESSTLDTLADEPRRSSGSAVLDFSDHVLYQADNFGRAMALPRAAVVPARLRDPDSARHYFHRLIRQFDLGPRCLIHGDAHLGNTFYPLHDGDAGFIDWQTYASGHWAFDVSHLLCTAMAPATRRRHEVDLLGHYLNRLVAHGGTSPGFDAAWQSYRCMVFYAFAWALCPPELQPEEVCSTCAQRAVAAMEDLGTLNALDDLPTPR
jgi:hypothetical protein